MMKSSKEMAEIWNVSERTVTTFCKSGKVPGAIKNMEDTGRCKETGRWSCYVRSIREEKYKKYDKGIAYWNF